MKKINKIKNKQMIIIGLLISFLIVVGTADAQLETLTNQSYYSSTLTCSVTNSCSFDTILKMSDLYNAHAENATSSNYNNIVCCNISDGSDTLSTSCSSPDDYVLYLSDYTNAHVEKYSGSQNYTIPICLSANTGIIDCLYTENCPSNYACLATISDEVNAHLADCDGSNDYSTKICCGLSGTSLTIYDTTDSSTINPNQMIEFYANYTNSTLEPINGTGTYCEIKFNITGEWTNASNMTFNDASEMYTYNYTVDSAGNYIWNVVCDGSSQGNPIIELADDLIITAVIIPSSEDGGGRTCTEDWDCTTWQPTICPITEQQTRICTDQNLCGTTLDKPDETRSCIYVEEEIFEETGQDLISITSKDGGRSLYNATIYQPEDEQIIEPDISGISNIKLNCGKITEAIETLLRVKEIPVENSGFTDFDFLIGIEANELLNCKVDIETDWLCIGIDYSLYKCKDWLFEEGRCKDDNSWEPILDINPGLQKFTIHLEPGDPGLGIGPSPITRKCGNNICDNLETCRTCSVDCGACISQPEKLNFIQRILNWFGSATGAAVGECNERWVCYDWSEYGEDGSRERFCTEMRNCGTTLNKPDEKEYCEFIELGCKNGILDQNENEIDCGGVCKPCVHIPIKIISLNELIFLIIALIIIGVVLAYNRHEHTVNKNVDKYALPLFTEIEDVSVTPYTFISLVNSLFGKLFYYINHAIETVFEFMVNVVISTLFEIEEVVNFGFEGIVKSINAVFVLFEYLGSKLFEGLESINDTAIKSMSVLSKGYLFIWSGIAYISHSLPKRIFETAKNNYKNTRKKVSVRNTAKKSSKYEMVIKSKIEHEFTLLKTIKTNLKGIYKNISKILLSSFYKIPSETLNVFQKTLRTKVNKTTSVIDDKLSRIAEVINKIFRNAIRTVVFVFYEIPLTTIKVFKKALKASRLSHKTTKIEEAKASTKTIGLHHKIYYRSTYQIHKQRPYIARFITNVHKTIFKELLLIGRIIHILIENIRIFVSDLKVKVKLPETKNKIQTFDIKIKPQPVEIKSQSLISPAEHKYNRYLDYIERRMSKKIGVEPGDKNLYLKQLSKMERYINYSIENNIGKSSIIKNLTKVGWPQRLVNRKYDFILNSRMTKKTENPAASGLSEKEIKLKAYDSLIKKELVKMDPETETDISEFKRLVTDIDKIIKGYCAKGYKKKQIIQILKAKGIPEKIVNRHLNIQKLEKNILKDQSLKSYLKTDGKSKFEEFMTEAIVKGYNKADIQKMLISQGWPKRFVEEHYENLHKSYEQEVIENSKKKIEADNLGILERYFNKKLNRLK